MNWEAYKEGREDCKKVDGEMRGYDNKYPEGTESYKSYRRGWNEYWESKWRKMNED